MTDQLLVMCKALHELLESNKQAKGYADVLFGDHTKIPRTPTLCVEPDMKRRELDGVPMRTRNTMQAYIIIYVSRVADAGSNAEEVLRIAESTEALLHEDVTLGGLLIHGYCTLVEPGYRQREGTMFRACRISYEGLSKNSLTVPGM